VFPITHRFIAAYFASLVFGSAATAPKVQVIELNPFTHVAYIQVGADLSSIKFKGVKAVQVATKLRSVTYPNSCGESWAEPGGSMYCPRTTAEANAPAFQVSYSYKGQPMASDEHGSSDFTFSVYFRPDELSQEVREALSSGKIFRFTTGRDSVQQIVIDQANSALCDGNYVDGNWIHTNPQCEDQVSYTAVTSASAYITVKVDPASTRIEAAARGR
jgi:hypothetical protein